MNTITLEELSSLTGYGIPCVRSYLQGYRFTRFEQNLKVNKRTRLVYRFDQEFVDEFTKFIWERKRIDVKRSLQKKLLSKGESHDKSKEE